MNLSTEILDGAAVSLPNAPPQFTRARRSGVQVRAHELRRRMDRLGLYGADLARRAHVAEATISRALNGRRIQPATFRAIALALSELEPVPGVDGLIEHDGPQVEAGRG